jgi:hypothetical protein
MLDKMDIHRPASNDPSLDIHLPASSVNPIRLKNNPIGLDDETILQLYEGIVC